jgi:hypothetical protein
VQKSARSRIVLQENARFHGFQRDSRTSVGQFRTVVAERASPSEPNAVPNHGDSIGMLCKSGKKDGKFTYV